MKSSLHISPPHEATPFERWMAFCLLPATGFYEVFGAREGCGSSFDNFFYMQVLVMTSVFAVAFGGAGLVLWGLLRVLSLGLRRTRRRIYYPAERERRRKLAAERREVRQRHTINAAPTANELVAQFARVRRNPQEMIRFGSMLCDLEAYVDNSLRRNDAGAIVGRNPGIKGWLAENCPELAAKYSTVMRYKALAEQFRQVVGLRDPYPAALVLPDSESEAHDASEAEKMTVNEDGKDENEITVRTNMLKRPEIVRAREVAVEFIRNCSLTQRSLVAELDARLSPQCVTAEMERSARMRRELPSHSCAAVKVERMFA